MGEVGAASRPPSGCHHHEGGLGLPGAEGQQQEQQPLSQGGDCLDPVGAAATGNPPHSGWLTAEPIAQAPPARPAAAIDPVRSWASRTTARGASP